MERKTKFCCGCVNHNGHHHWYFCFGKRQRRKKPKQTTTATNETNTMLVVCYGEIHSSHSIDSRKIHSTGVKKSNRNFIEQAYDLTKYIQPNRHNDKSIHMHNQRAYVCVYNTDAASRSARTFMHTCTHAHVTRTLVDTMRDRKTLQNTRRQLSLTDRNTQNRSVHKTDELVMYHSVLTGSWSRSVVHHSSSCKTIVFSRWK